jgi:hypothetical protein
MICSYVEGMLALFQSENNNHVMQLMTLSEMSASKILITLQATTFSAAHITGSHNIFFRKSSANLNLEMLNQVVLLDET